MTDDAGIGENCLWIAYRLIGGDRVIRFQILLRKENGCRERRVPHLHFGHHLFAVLHLGDEIGVGE